MTDYALVNLSNSTIIGSPGALPEMFRGLAQTSLNDLSFTGSDHDGEFVGKGFWPVVESRPPLGAGQRYAASPVYTVNGGPKTVTAAYSVETDHQPALISVDSDRRSLVRRRANRLIRKGRFAEAATVLLKL